MSVTMHGSDEVYSSAVPPLHPHLSRKKREDFKKGSAAASL